MAKKPPKKPTPKVNLTSGKGGKITQRGANTIPRYGLPSSTRPLLSDPGLPGTVAPRLPGTVAPGLPGTKATPKQVAEYKVGKMVQKRAAEKQAKARAARIPNYGLPGTVAKPAKGGLPGTVAKPAKGGLPGTVAKPAKPIPKYGLPGTVAKPAKPIPKYGLPSSTRPLLSDPGLPGTVARKSGAKVALGMAKQAGKALLGKKATAIMMLADAASSIPEAIRNDKRKLPAPKPTPAPPKAPRAAATMPSPKPAPPPKRMR